MKYITIRLYHERIRRWDLERLREECARREIVVNAKDGVKTLAGRLRVSDKVVQKVQEVNESVELETDRGVF